MRFPSPLIPAMAAGLIVLAACGQPSNTSSNKPGLKINTDQDSKISVSTGDKEFDATLRCWALTSGAYFVHMALHDKPGNLPNPDENVYGTWGKKLAIMAYNKKMGFDEFQAMKNKAKGSVSVYSLEVEPEYAAAVQKCIDTTPPPINEPDPSWP